MIKQSQIQQEAKNYIITKLNDIAKTHNIKIILAVESGSRAWGFPSCDSDYDVRFIYIRKRNDYLSIENIRDVIETPLFDDPFLGVPFDLNGWDIKKALQLSLKSNAILIEWLASPICYIKKELQATLFSEFVNNITNLSSVEYHYCSLTKAAWDKIVGSNYQPTIKQYCYCLRPALTLKWIRDNQTTPPMDLHSLTQGLQLDFKLSSEIADLIGIKYQSNESDTVQSFKHIDNFLTLTMSQLINKPKLVMPNTNKIETANILFRKLIDNE